MLRISLAHKVLLELKVQQVLRVLLAHKVLLELKVQQVLRYYWHTRYNRTQGATGTQGTNRYTGAQGIQGYLTQGATGTQSATGNTRYNR